MLAIVVALVHLSGQAFVSLSLYLFDAQSDHLCSHTSHTCSKYPVTDPDNPDYPGIPDGADGGA